MLHAQALKLSTLLSNDMRRKRSGISTIIGATFFLLTIISALSVMSWTLQQQANFSTATSQVSALQLERQKSSAGITDAQIVNGQFSISLQNNGPLTEHLVRVWVTDGSVTNFHKSYDVNYLIGPKVTLSMGQELGAADSTHSYTIKAVTERGTIVSFKTVSVSDANLQLTLTVVPPNVLVGQNATVILSVTNNQNDVQAVHNINPILNNPPLLFNCGGPNQSACPTVTQKIPTPPSNPPPVNSLLAGSTATFKWVYNIGPTGTSSSVGTLIRFTATLGTTSVSDDLRISQVTIDQTNFASESGTLTIDYNSLQWMQSNNNCGNWQSGWLIPHQSNTDWTVFEIKITNHDPKNYIILDTRTQFFLGALASGVSAPFYIVNATSFSCPNVTITPYDYDVTSGSGTHRLTMSSSGGTATVFFAGVTAGNSKASPMANAGTYTGTFVIFGQLGTTKYGQNVPFIGVQST